MSSKKITIEGFLDEFKNRHDQMADRPFCWVLGSGASVQSGIPTGSTLVQQWLMELHRQEDFTKSSIEEWATADNLGIPGFEYERAANFYPWVYQRRFHDYKEQGYAFLEKVMERAEPSFGYSVLAQIMATTQHKVAITTNFDNLVADALSIYTRTFPLVCGHESLTGYIRANLRRPLVAKIHRDLLLAPLSSPEEIAKLPGEWASALKKILDRFTPVVIGYGGNDGSLMGFLKELTPIEGGIFWCYREGDDVEELIDQVVDLHRGRLVPIAGFDEVMLQFQEKLQLPFLLPQLQGAHDKRVAAYQHQFEMLTTALRQPGESSSVEKVRTPARKAAEAAIERLTKEKDWWAWQLKANAELDPSKKEAIYRAGLDEFPNSPELTGNFALFMEDVRKEYDEAERLYRKALELDPHSVAVLENLAIFLGNVREDYAEAEVFYRKALELDPNKVTNIGNFALFMEDARKEYDQAEQLYHQALKLDPNNAAVSANFGVFMEKRKQYDEAERLYRKVLQLDPNNAKNLGNLAAFMADVRKNYEEAEVHYRRALELDPQNAINAGNFAQFLTATNKFEEARVFATRALHLLGATPSQTLAEVALTHWLADRALSIDGSASLGRLKAVFAAGFPRAPSSFDRLLAERLSNLPENEQRLAKKLVAAILDEKKVKALKDEPLWKAAPAVPLSVPWPG